jgi:hypothetical protein
MSKPLSYDDHQREAILVRCLRCRKWWYQTVIARFICAACR